MGMGCGGAPAGRVADAAKNPAEQNDGARVRRRLVRIRVTVRKGWASMMAAKPSVDVDVDVCVDGVCGAVMCGARPQVGCRRVQPPWR